MQRVADAKKSFNGDCNSHEDSAAHADVGDWVDDEWEEDFVDVTFQLKGLECVVNSSDDDVGRIKASQSYQHLVKAVSELGL